MRMDKLVTIQIRDEETEKWRDWKKVLASVNWVSGSEGYQNGSEGIRNRLQFSVRYQPFLDSVAFEPGLYRLIYHGKSFNIVGHDDYFEQHNTVRIIAESDGEPA